MYSRKPRSGVVLVWMEDYSPLIPTALWVGAGDVSSMLGIQKSIKDPHACASHEHEHEHYDMD